MNGVGLVPTQVGDVVIWETTKGPSIFYIARIHEAGVQHGDGQDDRRIEFGFQPAVEVAMQVVRDTGGRIYRLNRDTYEWQLIAESGG